MAGVSLSVVAPGRSLAKGVIIIHYPGVAFGIMDQLVHYARNIFHYNILMDSRAPRKSNIARASEPQVSVSKRLGARLKQLRADKEWSLEDLAAASGVSRSMLSQIEREQANPTLAVTLRIARAFEMSLGELIETPEAAPSITVIRADDKAHHYRSDRFVRIRTLSPLHLEKDVELYEVQLQASGALRSAAHFEGTREFLTVQNGLVRVESGEESELLRLGDSANYRADLPHAIINEGTTEAVVFLAVIYR
jgi:transcriptional regulator with XRE-family HTH domain